jgi:hypothetical protein
MHNVYMGSPLAAYQLLGAVSHVQKNVAVAQDSLTRLHVKLSPATATFFVNMLFTRVKLSGATATALYY